MKKILITFLMVGLIFSLSHIANAQLEPVTLSCVWNSDCSTATRSFNEGSYTISVTRGAMQTFVLQEINLNGPYWFWGMNIGGDENQILGDYSAIDADNNNILDNIDDPNDGVYRYAVEVPASGFVNFSVGAGQTKNLTFFIDDPGQDNNGSLTANIAVVPEPISSILFLVGGSTLAARRFMRRKKIDRQ